MGFNFMINLALFVQETLCMPPGLECYKSVKKGSESCVPCEGIYFHVNRDEDFKPVEQLEVYKTTIQNYKEYKSGFINGTEGRHLL